MPAATEPAERRGIRGLFAKRAAAAAHAGVEHNSHHHHHHHHNNHNNNNGNNNAWDITGHDDTCSNATQHSDADANANANTNTHHAAPPRPPPNDANTHHAAPPPPPPPPPPPNDDRDKVRPSISHRRDSSSILSLTTSVTEGVKRSVSLRSHRTNLSSASSFGGGAPRGTARSTSGGPPWITPLSSQASPVEDGEVTGLAPSPKKERVASTLKDKDKDKDNVNVNVNVSVNVNDNPPALKRKLSLAKGLSHKFRSAEALPHLNAHALTQVNLDGGVKARSPPDGTYHNPLSPIPSAGVSMLVGTAGGHAPPSMNRKLSTAPSERPGVGLHTQSSFSRDISSHSNHPNGAPLSHAPNAPTTIGGGGPLNPNTIYTQIQETSAKRMATIDYMRRFHDGDIFYFSTFHYSPAALSTMPSLLPHKLGRRATNYFILGYSLPALLDMNCSNPLEYLKALTSLLVEFETFQNMSGFDSSGNVTRTGRVGAMLKSGMGLNRAKGGRRSSTAIDPVSNLDPRQADLLGMPTSARSTVGDSGSPHDLSSPINPTGHEFTYLLTPHLPFEPDFSTTLGTLCDTLIDTYGKLLDLVNGPDSCSPMVGTEFAKADKAIRKILVANVVREFEDTTRAGIKGEIAGLGKLALGGLM